MDDSAPKSPHSAESTATIPTTRPRWWPLWLILAAGAIAVACFQGLPDSIMFRGLRVIGTLSTCGAVLILFIAWLLGFSRLSPKVKYSTLTIVLLPLVVFFALRRIDAVDGDMFPITTWRWTPRSLDALDDYMHDSMRGENTPVDVSKLRTSSDHDYPGFLGRDRNSVEQGVQLATDWDARPPKQLWRHPVGLGWSAFAVAGDFAITQEQRSVANPPQECVVAYELRTGKQIWVHTDPESFVKADALGGSGPRATPTIDGDRVYALGAEGTLNCLELTTGEQRWSTNILADASVENLTWGMAGSPLVVDDLVIVSPGGDKGYCVVAYDKHTGNIAWHSGSRRETAGYASPMLATLGGQRQVVMLTAIGLSGYEPETGEMLWHYPWSFANNQKIICAQPLVTNEYDDTLRDQIMISSGYGVGSEMIKITKGPSGLLPTSVWTTTQLKSKFSNMVLHKAHIFGLSEGILTCLDAKTGQKKWKSRDGYYGHGQMILCGDILLIQTERRKGNLGDVVLVEANPAAFKELAVLPALSNKTWNPPALAGNLLLVRNDHEAACYELPVVE